MERERGRGKAEKREEKNGEGGRRKRKIGRDEEIREKHIIRMLQLPFGLNPRTESCRIDIPGPARSPDDATSRRRGTLGGGRGKPLSGVTTSSAVGSWKVSSLPGFKQTSVNSVWSLDTVNRGNGVSLRLHIAITPLASYTRLSKAKTKQKTTKKTGSPMAKIDSVPQLYSK